MICKKAIGIDKDLKDGAIEPEESIQLIYEICLNVAPKMFSTKKFKQAFLGVR